MSWYGGGAGQNGSRAVGQKVELTARANPPFALSGIRQSGGQHEKSHRLLWLLPLPGRYMLVEHESRRLMTLAVQVLRVPVTRE